MSATAWPLIEIDDAGTPRVSGTTTKVIEIALDQLAYGWDADTIHREHPHLSLPQIHAALGYYHQHRAECDARIEESLRYADECRRWQQPIGLIARLRAHHICQ